MSHFIMKQSQLFTQLAFTHLTDKIHLPSTNKLTLLECK